MRCAVCGLEMDSARETIIEGWVPYILEGESEQEGPVCSSCLDALFEVNEYGEFVLMQKYRGKISYFDGGFDEIDFNEIDLEDLVLEYSDN